MNSQNDEIEIDLWEILLLLSRHLFGIAAVTIACALAAGLISLYALKPMYTSTSQIYILTNQDTMVSHF